MPTPTDLRAALRDAADALASEAANKRATIHAAVFGDGIPSRYDAIAERCRTIADAPPTVAELLARVDAGHEVRWQCSIEAKAECRAVYADGNIAIQWRHPGGRWRSQEMTAADLIQPGRLVEVSP